MIKQTDIPFTKCPYLATDAIIEIGGIFGQIVVIERLNPPLGYALPGGFVDYGETLAQCVVREVKEEVSLDAKIRYQLKVYDDPKRDPRAHVITVVFVLTAWGTPIARDDAKRVRVLPWYEVRNKKLVADHNQIFNDYIERERS